MSVESKSEIIHLGIFLATVKLVEIVTGRDVSFGMLCAIYVGRVIGALIFEKYKCKFFKQM